MLVITWRLLPVHTEPAWENVHSSSVSCSGQKQRFGTAIVKGVSSPLSDQRLVSFQGPHGAGRGGSRSTGYVYGKKKKRLCFVHPGIKSPHPRSHRSLSVIKHGSGHFSTRAFVQLWWLFRASVFCLSSDAGRRACCQGVMDNRRIRFQHPDEALAFK